MANEVGEIEIVCVEHERVDERHQHISKVGFGGFSNGYVDVQDVSYVLAAMKLDRPLRFFTIGSVSGVKTYVEEYSCTCGIPRIKTDPDNVKDNNLSQLPTCS